MTDKQGSGSENPAGSGNGASGLGNDSQSGTNAAGANPPAGNQGNSGNSGSADISALLARISSLEEQTKEIPKLRSEAAKYRTRLKALTADDEGKPEGGSGENPELSNEIQILRNGRIRDQLTSAADRAGAHAPNDIYRYFDNLSELAESDGTVKNPDKHIADLRKSYPFLFKPPVDGTADGNSGSGTSGKPGDMNSILRQGFRSLRGTSAG